MEMVEDSFRSDETLQDEMEYSREYSFVTSPSQMFTAEEKLQENLEKSIEMQEEEPVDETVSVLQQNTETVLKSEIKQVILGQVAEETTIKILQDLEFEKEEHTRLLQTRVDEAFQRSEELRADVEVDQDLMQMSENLLENVDDMIDVVKENVGKLATFLEDIKARDILKRSREQYERAQAQEVDFNKRRDDKKAVGKRLVDQKKAELALLQKELHFRVEKKLFLSKAKDEMTQKIDNMRAELQNKQGRKETLEQKLVQPSSDEFNTLAIQKVLHRQMQEKEKLKQEKENCLKMIIDLGKVKEAIQQAIQKSKSDVVQHQEEIVDLQAHITTETQKCNTLSQDLINVENENLQVEKELQGQLENLSKEIQDSEERMGATKSEYEHYCNELERVKTAYFELCEERNLWANKIISQKLNSNNSEIAHLQSVAINTNLVNKYQDLENKCKEMHQTVNTLSQKISAEKGQMDADLRGAELAKVALKEEAEQLLSEVKRNEYMSANNEFLKNQLKDLQEQAKVHRESHKEVQDEIETKKTLLDLKQKAFDNLKIKLEGLVKPQEQAQGGFKSPAKKVQFNEVLQVKSPTNSSDTSNNSQQSHKDNSKPKEDVEQSPSFDQWLQNYRFQSLNTCQSPAEFN